MNADASSIIRAPCPQCGRQLRVPAAMAGRRGKCNVCGHEFRIPVAGAGDPPRAPGSATAQPSAGSASANPPTPGAASSPPAKHVSFNCDLCETRMTVGVSQVGRKAKCPDCGHLTVVPPPPAPRAPVVPAAMYGEQYELWGVDEAPTPQELAAAATRLVAVRCRLCDTLMYARFDQIGESLVCPDCGAKTPIVAPISRPSSAVLPPAPGDDYELDPASAPTPRPVPRIAALIEAERHQATRARYDDDRRRKDTTSVAAPSGQAVRDKCPRVPLVQGAASMLLTSAVATRWMTLSAGLIVVAWFAVQGLSGINSQMGAIMAVCFLAMSVMLGGCWFVAASAMWMAVLTESADGHRRLHDPPTPMFLDWLGDAAYILIAAASATLPAWLVARFVPLGSEESLAAGAVVWLATFPVMLLSALEEGAAMGVFSPRVWGSLVRRPWIWALFFIETAMVWGAVGLAISAGRDAATVLGPPLVVAASLAYFRLMGLTGWWLAESLAVDEPPPRRDERDYRKGRQT